MKIVRHDGASMGEVPVEMVQLAVLEWAPDGAAIKLVGGWDFAKGLCGRLNRDQTDYVYVKGYEP